MKRTVSVIVPLYNAEKTLVRCVQSILRQTYRHLEVILVNDGSSDRSGTICENLALTDERIKVYHQQNAGPASARNVGIKRARGEYIQFVDADDVISAKMVETLLKTEKADLVICGYQRGNEQVLPPLIGNFSIANFLVHFGSFYKQTLLSSPCNKLYRSAVLQTEEILFPENVRYGEDLRFNLAYLQHAKSITVVNDVLYIYQESSKSLTHAYIPNLYRQHIELDHIVRTFLRENNAETMENMEEVAITFANRVLHSLANLFHPESPFTVREKKQFVREIMKDPYVLKQQRYFCDSLQARLFQFFLRKQLDRCAYYYFFVKEWLRHHQHFLFRLLRKLNK